MAERCSKYDFNHPLPSKLNKWGGLLQTDGVFADELAQVFGEWLEPYNKGSDIDLIEDVWWAVGCLHKIGFWNKISCDTFLEKFGGNLNAHVVDFVRAEVQRMDVEGSGVFMLDMATGKSVL